MQSADDAYPFAPAWLARVALAALLVMTGIWLVIELDLAAVGVAGAVVLVLISGAVAGVRFGWFVVPASFWLMFGIYEATECAECGSGGEEVVSPVAVLLAVSMAISLLALAGGALGLLVRRFDDKFPPRYALAMAGVTAVVFVGLVVARARETRDANGEVVFEISSTRYRTGNAVDDPRRVLAEAAAESLHGEAPVWLGDTLGPFKLSRIQRGPDSVLLVYGTCGPAPCSGPATLMMTRMCGTPPEISHSTAPPVTREGVVFVEDPIGATHPGGKKVLWTGRLSVTIYGIPGPINMASVLASVHRLDGEPLAPANPDC